MFSFLLLPDAVSSTMLYNFLNFPAGVVPISTVTEADEEELKLYRGCCNDPWDRTLKQVCDTESGGAETADGCSIVSLKSGAPKCVHQKNPQLFFI